MTFNLPFIKHKSDEGNLTRRDHFHNLFNDLFNEFYSFPTSASVGNERSILPRTDISETDSAYCIEVELPGMQAKDIELKIDNNMLTIKGKRDETTESKEKNYYMRERYYGIFQRSITLPSNIDEMHIDAQFDNGILCINIPKKEIGKTKKIDIK
ncbi:Hsp20/alpha crystallin family protein [Candidatus Cardinium hertigii]|uniref:Hsp20/alpha crystallin family protein n=1 Tax=Candidatus Cardinium hertigii TaxID=247481 RepID=A0A3N2QCJ8_9BACT|nr:Hsp20/alpha crystallin family protein [Candidatus Cardinium hertigii]ROT47518.1 Hsp20/alpha crystallin family protein [Candidatus Cardinium hertigii]